MQSRIRCVLVIAAGLSGVSATGATTSETQGRLDEVTVYRGQALVTRLVDVPGPAGLHEVVVTDLPEHVVPGSIYAESADGAVVRSVRYRVRPVSQDVREEVRALDVRIGDAGDKQEANARDRDLAAQQKAYLDKLEQFAAPTANVELAQGVLDAETLKSLTLFLFEQRKILKETELELSRQQKSLDGQMELLQRERNELTGDSAKTVQEAVIFADVTGAGSGRVRLRYLVDEATWSPSYNVRTGGDREEVVVEYNAAIQQRSGEDWNDVSMTLSTATPTLAATAPALAPLTIALAPAESLQQQSIGGKEGYTKAHRELGQQARQLADTRNSLGMSGPASSENRRGPMQQEFQSSEVWSSLRNAAFDSALNEAAGNLQVLELATRAGLIDRSAGEEDDEAVVSVTYRLPTRTTLPSRSDRQLIQIASLPTKAEFYRVASPVLTSYVYEEAVLTNASEMLLLAGPASVFADGEFVGHGEVPTVAMGASFPIGFGIDSSLRASRELVNKSETTQGGNRIVSFNYRLSVENFATAPVDVRVFDRLPRSKGSDIKVTLVSGKAHLSDDHAYQSDGRNKGILRWDTQIPAEAIGPQAMTIDYEFQIEYDRQMAITGLAMAD